jgi:predicted ATPase
VPPAAVPAPVEVFLSYSHQDKSYLRELKKHLAVLENRRRISTWSDHGLDGGDDLDEIWPRLDAADLVVLLISENFISSRSCSEEMLHAYTRHQAGQASVVPVILKPCDWQEALLTDGGSPEEVELLGRKIALPRDGKPIITWKPRQEGYLDVVRGLKAKIDRLVRDRRERERPQAGPSSTYFYNLRVPPTPFIGREKERKELKGLLASESVRLVVLTGPGGVGKTRLAERVASELKRRFRHGVCMVRLGQVSQPEAVVPVIAKTLEIKESLASPVEAALADYLATKQMLLLLDNFEQVDPVAPAGEKIAGMLEKSPDLKVLITSRSDLNIVGRYNFPVPLLSVPPPGEPAESLSQYDAVKLFIETARRGSPNFAVTNDNAPAVAEICHRLEGLALSIELVAATVGHPPNLKRLLRQVKISPMKAARYEALGEERQHWSLEATITYSYKLLNEEEQRLFRQLAVFGGGCRAEDVAAVWSPSSESKSRGIRALERGLTSLVAKSLLRQQPDEVDQEFRFKMLDVVREYALDRLEESGELEQGRRRHAEHFTALAEKAETKLTSAERGDWLKRLDSEHGNFQAALEWCGSEEGDCALGLRLAGALFWFWNMRGDFQEGRHWLEEMLRRDGAPPPVRAKALYGAGGLAFLQGDYRPARRALEESVQLWREIGDRRRLGYALVVLGMTSLNENDFETARRCERESLEIFGVVMPSGELMDPWGYALALNDLGNVLRAENRHAEALDLYHQSLKRWRRMKDPWGMPLTLSNIGFLEMIAGNLVEAKKAFESALKSQREEKDRWGMGETLKYLADLAVRDGRDADADRLYRESLALNREIGRTPFVVGCLAGLAVLAARSGRDEYTANLAGAVDRYQGAFRASAKSIDHGMYDPTVRQVGARFGRFEAVRGQGREMDLAAAVDYALDRAAA